MKTTALAFLIAFILLQSAKAIIFPTVELTPDNLKSNGFSIRFISTKEEGYYQILIAFDKLPSFLDARCEARLDIRDSHNLIASVTLEPIDGTRNNRLGYSIRLSPSCASNSKLWLSEGYHSSSDRYFVMEFSKFNTVEQDAAANP